MTEYNPSVLKYRPDTQKAVNNLPYHSKIRRGRDSIGHILINYLFGNAAYDIRRQLTETQDDGYIMLANKDQPDIIWTAQLRPDLEFPAPTRNKNLLHNSSFEIWTNELRIPDWWQFQVAGGGLVLVGDSGVIGSRCLDLHLPPRADVTVWQTLPDDSAPALYSSRLDPLLSKSSQPFKLGQKIALSMYYRIDEVVSVNATATLTLRCYRKDSAGGAFDDFSLNIPFSVTSGWTRVEILQTASVPYSYVEVRFHAVNTDPTATEEIFVDALQLEFNDTVTRWEPYIYDKPFYCDKLNLYGAARAVSEYGVRVQWVPNTSSFWHNVPTRLDLVGARELSSAPSAGRAGFEYEVDFWGDQWTTEWEIGIHDGVEYIYKKGVEEEAEDSYGRYLLALSLYNGVLATDTGTGYSHLVHMQALTYFQQKLWVVGTAGDYHDIGTPVTCLFVADPATPWPEPEYLEAMSVLKLTGWPGGDPVRVEFQVDDQQHIYIYTNTHCYCYRLYYDYFLLDAEARKAHFREEYDRVCVMPVEKREKAVANILRRY